MSLVCLSVRLDLAWRISQCLARTPWHWYAVCQEVPGLRGHTVDIHTVSTQFAHCPYPDDCCRRTVMAIRNDQTRRCDHTDKAITATKIDFAGLILFCFQTFKFWVIYGPNTLASPPVKHIVRSDSPEDLGGSHKRPLRSQYRQLESLLSETVAAFD